MRGSLTAPVFVLLLVAVHLAAAVAAVASPVAACPILARASHAGHADYDDRGHRPHSDATPGGDANCCLAICLVGVSLPAPAKPEPSPAFRASIVIYWPETAVLPTRSPAPDPDPPRPSA